MMTTTEMTMAKTGRSMKKRAKFMAGFRQWAAVAVVGAVVRTVVGVVVGCEAAAWIWAAGPERSGMAARCALTFVPGRARSTPLTMTHSSPWRPDVTARRLPK